MRLKSVSKYGTSSASRNSDNDFNESNNGVDDLDLDSGDVCLRFKTKINEIPLIFTYLI